MSSLYKAGTKFYKISENELIDLLESEYMLLELQNAGVDNWPGYEEADLWNSDEYINSEITGFEEIK